MVDLGHPTVGYSDLARGLTHRWLLTWLLRENLHDVGDASGQVTEYEGERDQDGGASDAGLSSTQHVLAATTEFLLQEDTFHQFSSYARFTYWITGHRDHWTQGSLDIGITGHRDHWT